MRFSTIVSVVTLVRGISPRQPSGKNIIRWLLKKRTNGSVRYCQYTSITEAIQANIELFSGHKHKPLTARINSDNSVTLHSWLDRYEKILASRGIKQKTLINYMSKIKAIRRGLPDAPLEDITTKEIAAMLNGYIDEGKAASAKLIRSTLSDAFREAIAEGHITTNPVAATRAAKSEVRRSRLTADEYLKIYQAAESSPCWLRLAMELAVVTGQRVGDLCEMKWSDIVDGYLYVEQSKTGVKIAIPTTLHVDALGISMKETLDKCKEILGGETIIASTRREPLSSGTVSSIYARTRSIRSFLRRGSTYLSRVAQFVCKTL
ncbi:putative integrase [Shigella flexneri 5 str. 8401]|uniref:Putative integrase n=1 Tax=Shigella flexneri serotype 5b (strain 8401) TaxID=373384 RepID=Q0T1N8_SHIF8|nr:putative integrase [Shigella flexneri 5 str. 8401]